MGILGKIPLEAEKAESSTTVDEKGESFYPLSLTIIMACTFHLMKGHGECRRFNAAGTMGINTLCSFNENGEVVASATNKDIVGIVLEAATSATEPLVQILESGDVIEARGTGVTMVDTAVGNHADQATGNEVSLTDTNKDFLITGWDGVTATKLYLSPKFLAFGTGAAKE